MKKYAFVIFALCGLVFSGCAGLKPAASTPGVVVKTAAVGGSSYRKVYETAFNGSSSFVWKAAATAPAIRAVEMSYTTGVTLSNTFTLSYLRNGISRDLITVSGSMHTASWYVPSVFYPLEGDVWNWTNSAAGNAVFTINADYQQ